MQKSNASRNARTVQEVLPHGVDPRVVVTEGDIVAARDGHYIVLRYLRHYIVQTVQRQVRVRIIVDSDVQCIA